MQGLYQLLLGSCVGDHEIHKVAAVRDDVAIGPDSSRGGDRQDMGVMHITSGAQINIALRNEVAK